MATATVTGTVTGPDDAPSPDAVIVAELYARTTGPGVGFVRATTSEVAMTVKTRSSDGSVTAIGTWELELVPNVDIDTPAGSLWRIVYAHRLNQWGPTYVFIDVPAEGGWIGDLLTDLPDFSTTLSGDVTGRPNATTVVGLQGQPVSTDDPATGDALVWSGTAWEPDPAPAAGLAAETAARIAADLTLVPLTQKGAPGGVAELDGSGLVPVDQLPPIAISGQTFDVASEAAMLALAANPGDTAIRSDMDPDGFFVLRALPASTLANWFQLLSPGTVLSVDGRTGTVSLSDRYDPLGSYNLAPAVFSKAGTVAVATGKARYPITSARTLESVNAVVDTAPTDADLILNLLLNGVVIVTLTIADGTNAVTTSGLGAALDPGDYLTLDVVQVGDTIAGWDLTVTSEFAAA